VLGSIPFNAFLGQNFKATKERLKKSKRRHKS
jgi:hypothetical protein